MALAAAPANAALAQGAPAKPPPPAAGKTVGEIVVTGQAAPVQTSIDRRSYSVAGDLQAQSGSIGDALRNVPSVEVDVQGNIALRGDSNVTILIDGKPSSLFQGDNKAQALQQLPADRIARVEVITNPSAEFRADGSAGIINLVTKSATGVGATGSLKLQAGSADRASMSASAGYNDRALSLSGDLNYRHDTQRQATTEDRQQLDAAVGGFDGAHMDQLTHLRFDGYNARGAADYDLSAKTRLSGELRGNYTDFNVGALSHFQRTDPGGGVTGVFDRGLDVDQGRANVGASTTLKYKFDGEGEELTLKAAYDVTNDRRVRTGSTESFQPAQPLAFDRQRIDNLLRQADMRGDYVRPLSPVGTLKLGFDLQFDDNSYNNRGFRGPALTAFAPDLTLTNRFLYKQQLSQAYVTYERPVGDLTVQAGLRLEDVRQKLTQATLGQRDDNDYTRLYPSLHLAWKLSDTQQLTASYSHRVQRPQPDDLNAFRFLIDPLNLRAGNPRLRPQDTDAFELGWQYRRAPTLLLATLFYQENRNGVADVVRDIGGGVFLTTRENLADSRRVGLELVASGKLTPTLSYNLSSTTYWQQLDATPGFTATRSILAVNGRASLNWQAAADDLVQLNGFLNSRRLTPQGQSLPTGGLDIGYRHKLSDRLAFVMTVRDVLHTYRDRQEIDTPALKTRLRRDFDTRAVFAGFTWTFGGGGGKARDPGFEFQTGAAPAP
jgi:outer membrane receptor protein involved in Fe transport